MCQGVGRNPAKWAESPVTQLPFAVSAFAVCILQTHPCASTVSLWCSHCWSCCCLWVEWCRTDATSDVNHNCLWYRICAPADDPAEPGSRKREKDECGPSRNPKGRNWKSTVRTLNWALPTSWGTHRYGKLFATQALRRLFGLWPSDLVGFFLWGSASVFPVSGDRAIEKFPFLAFKKIKREYVAYLLEP